MSQLNKNDDIYDLKLSVSMNKMKNLFKFVEYMSEVKNLLNSFYPKDEQSIQ
jgi:hypothetical protein